MADVCRGATGVKGYPCPFHSKKKDLLWGLQDFL